MSNWYNQQLVEPESPKNLKQPQLIEPATSRTSNWAGQQQGDNQLQIEATAAKQPENSLKNTKKQQNHDINHLF